MKSMECASVHQYHKVEKGLEGLVNLARVQRRHSKQYKSVTRCL